MSRFLIILGVVYIILSFYGFQAFKTLFKNPWAQIVYGLVFLAVLINLYVQFFNFDRSNGLSSVKAISGGIFFSFFILAFLLGIFMLLEDIVRLVEWFYLEMVGKEKSTGSYYPTRRKFISGIALGIASIPFASLLYGMYKGKYNYKVLKYTLEFDDLPNNFDGYQITQISDIHSGSFDNREKIAYGIDLINAQKSDVIFFTGDMVNNKAEEMRPWMDLFSKLQAKDGKFSILGNHDYGDYVSWESDALKKENLEELKHMQQHMGFDLLLNDSRYLQKGTDKIALVGVENWGGGFKKAGDLKKAASRIKENDFKILLSHDPSHWELEVIKDAYHYHLTLSGHTHGMQFGIEIPGWFKWSPVKWRYKYWAGIYKELGQYINVNRGFGFIGYPGRVGIWPEITVITLKKKALT